MKILKIGTTDNSGGAAAVSWILKNELEKRGHQTPMFVGQKHSDASDVFKIPKFTHRYFHFILSNDVDFFYSDWILKTKEFKEADIIHLHNIHGWFFKLKTLQKISKLKPVVWTLHDMWSITPHCSYSFNGELKDGFYQCPSMKIYPRIFWHNEKYLSWKKRKVYNNSDFNLVVPSLWLKNKVEESVLGKKKIDLIYNGIDYNVFRPRDKQKIRKELNLPQDKKIILFLTNSGKHNPTKGWIHAESIIDRFKYDKEKIFICLGGQEKGQDENYKNLYYVPKITDKSKLSKYFTSADLFLFPSLADNCPLVILEAMSCGTPIVTFETGGIPELVTHKENGYIAKYKNNEDLLSGVNYILNLNDDEIAEISEKSREKVINNFTIDKMVDSYEKLYEDIINKYQK